MHIFLNNELTSLPEKEMSVTRLVEFKQYNPATTAVAINNHLIKRQNWENTFLKADDHVTLISAAFGG